MYGKHVFVDKPIANTLADGEKMIETRQKAGIESTHTGEKVLLNT
jgi:predicted dehydrogenase